MKYQLENAVVAEINRLFSPEDRQKATSLISNAELWCPTAGPPPRIHLAFLMKSCGNIEHLKNTIDAYAGDWRDLLIHVGLAGEDWRDFLRKKGIDSTKW